MKKKKTAKPSQINILLDPNTGTSEIFVYADESEHRDEALAALRSSLPALELLESSLRPEAVSIRLDDADIWFLGYDGSLQTADSFFWAKALTPEVAKEVSSRLVALGHKVSVFRNSKEDFATDLNAVWQ